MEKDHPRRCGEKSSVMVSGKVAPGSPPQVRGKGAQAYTLSTTRRITPAGAGKRGCAESAFRRCRDHPRRCGEKPHILPDGVKGGGSPPQVRGKDDTRQNISVSCRITPAGAGKRTLGHKGGNCGEDHPRRCGEKKMDLRLNCGLQGSPPQVRGKESPSSIVSPTLRITPAGAGKRIILNAVFHGLKDHPRRCGEKTIPKVPC